MTKNISLEDICPDHDSDELSKATNEFDSSTKYCPSYRFLSFLYWICNSKKKPNKI